MTTPVDWTSVDQALGAYPPASSSGSNEMNKDAFLKLLVAQLKYQDPMNPADGTAFLAQTAQFTQVEKLEEMASASSDMLAAQMLLSASSLVGKTVTYPGSEGNDLTGVVTAAHFGDGTPTLRVGDTDVPLASVTTVK